MTYVQERRFIRLLLHTNQKIIPNGVANIIENDMVLIMFINELISKFTNHLFVAKSAQNVFNLST